MPRMPPIVETVALGVVGVSGQPFAGHLDKTHTAMVSDAGAPPQPPTLHLLVLSLLHVSHFLSIIKQTTGQHQVSSYHWISTRKWDWVPTAVS